MGDDTPSNASIDALFAEAKSARIVAGPGFPGGVLLEVASADLGALRSTLRIAETEERFHCMCLGDLAIELRGRWLSAGRLSFHHGISVRLDHWCSDARLIDGPALLRFLDARGVSDPLREYERSLEEAREQASARDVWVAAAPSAIRASLESLENGPAGLPASPEPLELDAVIARVRGDGDDRLEGRECRRATCTAADRAVARVLLRWLAAGRGPWSGYASYENLPLRLLERLPIAPIVEVATDPSSDDAIVAAAARFFGDHPIVSFRKSALAAVPDAFFERARPLLRVEDDRIRHDHARRVANGARTKRGAPGPTVDGHQVIGVSTDGPLTGLAAVGDALVSVDVRTIVRFDEGSVAAVPIADAGDAYITLSSTSPIAWAPGRLGLIANEKGPIARGEKRPMEMASSERGVAWIADDGQGRALRSVLADESTVRTLTTASLLWCLAIDGGRVYWVEGAWRGGGTICSTPIEGGEIQHVAPLPEIGPSMGSPRYVIEGGEILLAVDKRVMAIDSRGEARKLIDAEAPIRAIAADAKHVALVVGVESDRDPPWSLASAPRTGGRAKTLATFARAPYHRHPLVIARGCACTVSGDRVIAARL